MTWHPPSMRSSPASRRDVRSGRRQAPPSTSMRSSIWWRRSRRCCTIACCPSSTEGQRQRAVRRSDRSRRIHPYRRPGAEYCPEGIGIMISVYHAVIVRVGGWLEPLALLALRLAGAKVFWESGLTKWNGFLQFNKDKYDLFLYEFFCPDPPRPGALQLCDSTTSRIHRGVGDRLADQGPCGHGRRRGSRVAGAAGARADEPALRAGVCSG